MKIKLDEFIEYLENHLEIRDISEFHNGMMKSQKYIIGHLRKSKSIEFTYKEILKLKEKMIKMDRRILYKTHYRAGNYCGLCVFAKKFRECYRRFK